MRDLDGGKKLHQDAVVARFDTNKFVAAALITMYSRCGSMPLAQQVFDRMIHDDRDVVVWNSLILGYVHNGESSVAMDLVTTMGCQPNCITYIAALKTCGALGLASEKEYDKHVWLDKGIDFHKQAQNHGFASDMYVASTLVDMYSKCGSMQRAKQVFDGMACKNVVAWNSLILGYVQNGQSLTAMDVFTSISCEPDSVTYVAALKACGGLATASDGKSERQLCLEKGIALHKQLEGHGFASDIVVGSTLVDMYSKCGNMDLARSVFERMSTKNVVTWTSLILGYVQNGESLVAIDLFTAMDCEPNSVAYLAALKACGSLASHEKSEKRFCLDKGIAIHKQIKDRGFDSDKFMASSLVDMYSRCGSMGCAREVFDKMACKDIVTWNSLILGYVQNGENLIAIDLFNSMDCEPDLVTYVAALKACGGLAASDKVKGWPEKRISLESGISIHQRARNCGCDCDIFVAGSLVDMYSKYGSMDRARDVFDRMLSKDVVTWTSLIMGYVQNGESSVAMDLFNRMDPQPDRFTYVAGLKACGSLAALSAGQQIHAKVCELGWEEDIVVANTLMDFYGNCGSMNRVEELFNNMRYPDTVSWNTLIAAYSSAGDSSRVFSLVEEMQKAGMQVDDITFTCILTACSHAGLVEEAKLYLKSMPNYGITLNVEHYNCVVDALGRGNRLREALAFINSMPFEADAVTWMSLLGSSRKWKNLEVGKVAFDALVATGTKRAAAYVLMSDIYGSCLPQWDSRS